MTSYITLLRKEPDSDYGVDLPDFPGCVSAGETMEEARKMAQEALIGHVRLMLEEGEGLPEPSKLETVMSDSENQEAVAFWITVTAPSVST